MLFLRELNLSFKQSLLPSLAFMLVVVLSFVLSSTGKADFAGVVSLLWSAVLLSHLLFVPFFFEEDQRCGLLALMLIEQPLAVGLVVVKGLALWVGAAMPLVLVAVLAGKIFYGGVADGWSLFFALSVGSLGLVFLNALGAAITCGLRSAFWLSPLIVLPLALPLVIFGAAASRQVFDGANNFFGTPAFMLLCGTTLLTLAIAPYFSHFALRNQTNA